MTDVAQRALHSFQQHRQWPISLGRYSACLGPATVSNLAKMLEEAKVDDLGKYMNLQYQLQINKITP